MAPPGSSTTAAAAALEPQWMAVARVDCRSFRISSCTRLLYWTRELWHCNDAERRTLVNNPFCQHSVYWPFEETRECIAKVQLDAVVEEAGDYYDSNIASCTSRKGMPSTDQFKALLEICCTFLSALRWARLSRMDRHWTTTLRPCLVRGAVNICLLQDMDNLLLFFLSKVDLIRNQFTWVNMDIMIIRVSGKLFAA